MFAFRRSHIHSVSMKMEKESTLTDCRSFQDLCGKFLNVTQLENQGPNHPDDRPRELKLTIRCTFFMWRGINKNLQETYSYRTDVVFFQKNYDKL